MKKRITIFIIALMPIIVISNIPPVRYILDYILDDKHYRYKNSSGLFDVTDRSGNNIKGVKSSFKEFVKSNNVKSADTILYRTFWKNPLAFWRWHTYFNNNDERYELPYKR